MLNRRRFIQVIAAGGAALLVAPRIVFARAATDRRFIFVIQRGAADGLNTVVPYADPGYAAMRGPLAVDISAGAKLDSLFALHPSLERIGMMYRRQEALFVHAVASPYRDRSHFDGQNVLETGGGAPYQVKDGWLNRLAGMLPSADPAERERAIAFAATIPMALRGRTDVTSYAPSGLPQAPDDLLARVTALYARDPQLHTLWEAAMDARGLAGDVRARQDPASIGNMAARFLKSADGPRIAMIETGGWDTHSAQMPRMAAQLKALDGMIAALREGLGDIWGKTTVLVATEFGRMVAANGTDGTDHGTASAAMILGGAVAGGRVIADWPGLRRQDLYQDRDLRPTTALDGLIAGVVSDCLQLDPELTARTLFARAKGVRPAKGLIRT
ncbi:DUF1501 domain-containing protein [Martelella alba]|uniref:DUF1501 domain-containing protein n=1 Tax=Martelella alba TaxID=2590451 RepID=A0ABY2SH52_9HYPH|nr:DUF1501 domain-containing protein [Martelella alba]TKI04593.1 DUF1501 domain-containing protein [Martelella alba]